MSTDTEPKVYHKILKVRELDKRWNWLQTNYTNKMKEYTPEEGKIEKSKVNQKDHLKQKYEPNEKLGKYVRHKNKKIGKRTH